MPPSKLVVMTTKRRAGKSETGRWQSVAFCLESRRHACMRRGGRDETIQQALPCCADWLCAQGNFLPQWKEMD